MTETMTATISKSRMLKSGSTARQQNGRATRRRPTPMHFLRVARLMTVTQLAAIVGVHRSTIARYEKGTDVPPSDQRMLIACILNAPVDGLWPPGEVLDRLLAS